MTLEEFKDLQQKIQESGKSITSYLKDAGMSYSNYYYWNKRLLSDGNKRDLAPIRFRESVPEHEMQKDTLMPSGVTVLFPNGLRVHFGSGTDEVLSDLLTKSLGSHVLP